MYKLNTSEHIIRSHRATAGELRFQAEWTGMEVQVEVEVRLEVGCTQLHPYESTFLLLTAFFPTYPQIYNMLCILICIKWNERLCCMHCKRPLFVDTDLCTHLLNIIHISYFRIVCAHSSYSAHGIIARQCRAHHGVVFCRGQIDGWTDVVKWMAARRCNGKVGRAIWARAGVIMSGLDYVCCFGVGCVSHHKVQELISL